MVKEKVNQNTTKGHNIKIFLSPSQGKMICIFFFSVYTLL